MLTQRKIFWFWLPLAFSFLLMVFEGPWIQGVMSRGPDAAVQLAAFGVVIGLAVLIETPVIMFLAVGSALARDGQSYRVLSRYVLIVNVLLTVIHILMAFTPLLDLYLGGVLDIPPELIDEARRPMAILILFSAFIGYRRVHQGILINHGRTRTITIGTVLRVVASAGVAFALGIWRGIPGAEIGAWSLIVAVAVEMVYVHIISREDVARLMATPRPDNKPPLTMRKVMAFHLPLAATALMSWFILPMTQRGLAQAPNAIDALAAYPVIFSIMMVMRAGGISWQEAVIALDRGLAERNELRRFTLSLGIGTSLLLLVFATTPAIDIYLRTILGIPEQLIQLVITGSLFAIFLPLFSTLQSYLRALLMGEDNTNPIYQAMMLGFILVACGLFGGIALGLPAIPVAVSALTLGVSAELLFLWAALVRMGAKPFLPRKVKPVQV